MTAILVKWKLAAAVQVRLSSFVLRVRIHIWLVRMALLPFLPPPSVENLVNLGSGDLLEFYEVDGGAAQPVLRRWLPREDGGGAQGGGGGVRGRRITRMPARIGFKDQSPTALRSCAADLENFPLPPRITPVMLHFSSFVPRTLLSCGFLASAF